MVVRVKGLLFKVFGCFARELMRWGMVCVCCVIVLFWCVVFVCVSLLSVSCACVYSLRFTVSMQDELLCVVVWFVCVCVFCGVCVYVCVCVIFFKS